MLLVVSCDVVIGIPSRPAKVMFTQGTPVRWLIQQVTDAGSTRSEDHVVDLSLTGFDSGATPLKSPTPTPLVLDQPLPQSAPGVMN